MERLGIIVDVTHMTPTALTALFEWTKRPFIASHSSARALGDHPYSFYDEHIQEISSRQSIMGVVLYPYLLTNYSRHELAKQTGSLRNVVRTVRHIVKICGSHRHVAIGSDFGGYIQGPQEMTCLGQIQLLRQLLMEEFDEDEAVVEAIMAGNVIRFLRENWRKPPLTGR
jgi:membrane dipeptidase